MEKNSPSKISVDNIFNEKNVWETRFRNCQCDKICSTVYVDVQTKRSNTKKPLHYAFLNPERLIARD